MKVKEIFEAQYDHKAQKNSLEWFLYTFFDEEEIGQLTDDVYEVRFVLKDDFKAEDTDGTPVFYVFGEYRDDPEMAEPKWHPNKDTAWSVAGEHTSERSKDPRNDLIIWYVKDAWPPAKRKINEAKYADNKQGTLSWFIHHFFDHYEDHEDYGGGIYKLKDGFEIETTDKKKIGWINSWELHDRPGEYDWEFLDDRERSAGASPDRVVVKKIKVLWDPKGVYDK